MGRLLARLLERPFVDLDTLIEEQAGCSIALLFSREGEEQFRRHEMRAVAGIVQGKGPSPVVACGGGLVSRKANRERLAASGPVFWLDVPWEEAARRCALQASPRPLLGDPAAFRRRLPRRLFHYRALGRRVDARLPPGEIAGRIMELLQHPGD